MQVAFGDRPAFTIWGTRCVFPRRLEMAPAAKSRVAWQTALNRSRLKGQAQGKKNHVPPAAKEVFPKSNIYAKRGTVVGIAHPFTGQCLQGKQSAASLPRALIIVLLAAWGKVLVLKTSSRVADTRLPGSVWLVCVSWGCWHMHSSLMFSG